MASLSKERRVDWKRVYFHACFSFIFSLKLVSIVSSNDKLTNVGKQVVKMLTVVDKTDYATLLCFLFLFPCFQTSCSHFVIRLSVSRVHCLSAVAYPAAESSVRFDLVPIRFGVSVVAVCPRSLVLNVRRIPTIGCAFTRYKNVDLNGSIEEFSLDFSRERACCLR